MIRLALVLPAALALVPAARAQTAMVTRPSRTLDRAAATITTADVARRVRIIADDSMQGRDTPSRGLELTAQYIADEFRRLGLKPGGEDGTWFQRYPITRRRFDLAGSSVTALAGNTTAAASFASAARFVFGAVPAAPIEEVPLVLGGTPTADLAGALPVRDRVVLAALDPQRLGPANVSQVLRALVMAGPKAVVLVSAGDSASFALRVPRTAPVRTVVDFGGPRQAVVLEVHEGALAPALRAAGLDLAQARAASGVTTREAAGLVLRLDAREEVLERTTAPNTIGILEGTDPKLRHEYVVFSAHMDHVGVNPAAGADSIFNGADDDASGTVGVVELAEAFAQPGARPKRSILFITVSGEEKGLWGSRYFSERPTVPLTSMVANVNMDMIGRNWPDTIVAIGREHSDLGETLAQVNAAHPELRMTAIDDRWPEERFYFRSDHFNFARKGVPILFFFNGVHDDYHRPSDSPDKIDAEKEARLLRLVFFLGQEVANRPARPKWNPRSYAEIVEVKGTP